MKKVYLETPEAVIKALKEGKTIKNEHGYSYELKDNFIIQTFLGEKRSINTTIFFDEEDYYILEEEPLKIEVGQWYETRDRQKARCYKCVRHLFFFTIDNVGNFSTLINGNYNINGVTSNLDIIGPWEE